MKIKSIKEIPYDGYVYDLSIRKNHNFVANNVVIHNCDRGVFYAKKRYILNVWDSEGVKFYGTNDKGELRTPEIKIMGIELVKSSTPKIVRDELKGSIKHILYGTNKDIRKYHGEIRSKFMSEDVSTVAFNRSVNDIGKWQTKTDLYLSGTPIHVRASIMYNMMIDKTNTSEKYAKIQNGDKIKFVYLKIPNPIHENVIAFPNELPEEFGLHKYVDYNLQFQKSFEGALDDMIKPLAWKILDRPSFDI